MAKLRYTWQIFILDFLENEASHEQTLYQAFFLFFPIESPCARLYYDFRLTQYNRVYLLHYLLLFITLLYLVSIKILLSDYSENS